MDVDQVYHLVGETGPQQVVYFIYCAIIGGVFVSGQMLQIVFTGATPDFTCWNGKNITRNMCDMHDDCKKPSYMSPYTSVVTEWSLVCGRAYLVRLVQSVFMMGVMVGAFAFGYISDRVGRRRTLLSSTVATSVFGFFGSMAPSVPLHAACRFLTGTTTASLALVSFVLMTELVGSSRRAVLGTLFPGFFALGIALHAALAYHFTNWRYYSVTTALLGLLCLPLAIWLPESPRWLLLHGKRNEAKTVLLRIAQGNNSLRCLPRTWDLQEQKVKPQASHPKVLFSNRSLQRRTLVQIFLWMVNGVTYYALTMAANALGGNLYVSTALSGLVEVPGYMLTAWFLGSVGRRHSLCAVMVLGGLSCIALNLLFFAGATATVCNILSLLGKMCIAASFAIVYIYSAELMPTVVRNIGMGVTSVAARVGGILSPFVSLLDKFAPALQFTVLGILMLVAGLAALLLPETSGKPLPETVSDVENAERDCLVKHVSHSLPFAENAWENPEEELATEKQALIDAV